MKKLKNPPMSHNARYAYSHKSLFDRPVREDLDKIIISTFKIFDHPEIINYITRQSDYKEYISLYSSESLAQYWYYKRNELKINKEFKNA